MTAKVILTTILMCLVCTVLGFAQAEEPQTAALTVEAELCTMVENLMPVGTATAFTADVGKVYLWCRVSGAMGETTIKHVWMHDGKEMATVDLAVRSSSWRTYSSKNIPEYWAGDWEVKILDAEGNSLTSIPFTVGGTVETPTTEEPEQPEIPVPEE